MFDNHRLLLNDIVKQKNWICIWLLVKKEFYWNMAFVPFIKYVSLNGTNIKELKMNVFSSIIFQISLLIVNVVKYIDTYIKTAQKIFLTLNFLTLIKFQSK
jgi:hypothetical protein